jgi:tetratricopeptide (TPR) repeat protein
MAAILLSHIEQLAADFLIRRPFRQAASFRSPSNAASEVSSARSDRRLALRGHSFVSSNATSLTARAFCWLGLDSSVTDHATFSKNRSGRFRDSDLARRLFENLLQWCRHNLRSTSQVNFHNRERKRDIDDLFALQNEITSRIAVALNLTLIGAEAARPTEHADAQDYILRGRAAMSKPAARDNNSESIGLFERALALDPHSVEAQNYLALALTNRVLRGMGDSAAADIARAEELAGQALAASPHSWLAHFAKGEVLRAQHKYAEAIPEYETVLTFNRNAGRALFGLGQSKLRTGAIEETIPLLEQAIRLSPRHPSVSVYYWQIGMVHLLQSRTDEAVVWFEKARNTNPAQPAFHAWLASAYGLKGETTLAAIELAEARRLVADDRYSSIARLRADGTWGVPKIRALTEATYFAGLRKAGVPEE